jgi:hypothetical protein
MPDQVIAQDLNGDGFPDLAVMHDHNHALPSYDPPYLTILYNDGSGHLSTRGEYSDSRYLTAGSMASADFDGDGHPDLVLADVVLRFALLMLNRGDGTFDPPVEYGVCGYLSNWPVALLAENLAGSARPDLVVVQSAGTITFLPNLQSACHANCDGSPGAPALSVADYTCFLNRWARGEPYANCDGSTMAPTLTVQDFMCFIAAFSRGCP